MTRFRFAVLPSLLLAGALALMSCSTRTSRDSGGGDTQAPDEVVLGRFSRWCGKVNTHQSQGGAWTPDSDCRSGCNIGGLEYCRKFWPETTVIRQAVISSKPESSVWANAGCGPVTHVYDGDDEFECVQAKVTCGDNVCNGEETTESCPADCRRVLGRFSRWCGKVNIHQPEGGRWTPDSDCKSGCDVGGLEYCRKFWPNTKTVRQVAVVSGKPADNTWVSAGCGPLFEDYNGDDEFECLE